MAGASSRLLFTFTGPISILRQRSFSLLRLVRRHSYTSKLPTLSRSNSLIPIKFSQKFHFRSASNALQQNSHAHAYDYGVRPSHPWPEWSLLLEALSVAGYFNGNSNIEDEFVANENLSMEFVAAARSCLAFARDRPDILGWLRRQDIEVLINDGSPYLFKNAIETERRMRSFLQAEESHKAITVDLMKYILSYASNPIIYPERNIKELTESSARYLLQEMANLSCRGRGSQQFQSGWRDEQMPRNLGPNVTMKRGDWICPKCSFMNFARNTKCLECEELRPQRQLAGGEWDCPQCNFFNYRRNVACLKCKFRLPEAKTHYQNESGNKLRVTNTNLDQFLGNDSTFSGRYNNDRIDRGQNDRKDSHSGSSYAKKPEKTTDEEDNKSERWFKKVTELHGVTDQASLKHDDFSQIMPVRKGDNRFEVSNNKERRPMQQVSNSSFAPFVPFPPDYFAKKNETSSSRSRQNTNTVTHNNNTVHETGNEQMSRIEARPVWSDLGQPTAENPNQETGNQQMIEARPERSNHGQTMPENPNLVQKEGNRQMRRTEARPECSNLGQTTPENPYLLQETGNQQLRRTEPRPEWSNLGQTMPENLKLVQETGNQHMIEARPEWLNHGQTTPENPNLVQETGNQQLRRREARPEWSNLSQTTLENSNRWTGKSLEGSAVTEPDPLDMSEEAKAERWFRRVAQIKDISELSEIPDEDFPSIMPMRKGVNRFVVSKRKTPLERRLTSPQYRKNLRVMSSEPMKKEGDNDN